MKRRALYDRRGPNAIEPQSYGGWFEIDVEPRADFEDCGGVAVVTIEGPLCQCEGYWFDDYGSITRRVTAALASACSAVVMRINSPGGESFGCIETSRALRAAAAAAGKPLVSFIEGYGASAAYALACAGERIYALPSSLVGSVGVIVGLYDYAEANKRFGLNAVMVKSGARKTDGHPDVALSEDALKAVQGQVDELAAHFVALVAETRGTTPEAVAGLEAGLFVATQKTPGVELIDGTATLAELLAMVASGSTSPRGSAGSEKTMDKETMLAALRKMAEGDDENAETAKAALAEIEGTDGEKSDEAKSEDEGDKKPEAEGEEEPSKDDEKDKPASRVSVKTAPKSALELRIDALEQKEERAKLLATRPDFAPSTVKWLSSAPLPTVRNAVKAIPKAETPKPVADPKAALTVPVTRGSDQNGDRTPRQSPEAYKRMAERMGIAKSITPAIRQEGANRIYSAGGTLEKAGDK